MRPLALMLLLGACQKPSPAGVPLPAPSDPRARLTAPSPPPSLPARPEATLDWLVEATGPIKRAELLKSFGDEWRRNHDLVRIYGWRAGAPLLVADDRGDSYQRVTLAMQLLKAAGDDDLRLVAAPHLQSFLADVTPRLRAAGATDVTAPVTPAGGAATAIRLRELFKQNGCELTLRLMATDGHPFDSKTVLDVLLSLGLTPGSGDAIEFADFAVKTRTPPGKLDAAALYDGKLRPGSLIFELYVPRAAHPVESWELLLQAGAYAQKRLGGRRELLMEDFGHAHPTDDPAARARVAAISAALAQAGFPPGAPSTTRLFTLP